MPCLFAILRFDCGEHCAWSQTITNSIDRQHGTPPRRPDWADRCWSSRSRYAVCSFDECRERPRIAHESNRLFSVCRWRAAFWLLAGLTVIPFIGTILLVKGRPILASKGDRRIDWLGMFLFTAGPILLFYPLSQARSTRNGWGTPCELLACCITARYLCKPCRDRSTLLLQQQISLQCSSFLSLSSGVLSLGNGTWSTRQASLLSFAQAFSRDEGEGWRYSVW